MLKNPDLIGPVIVIASGLIYCGLCYLKGES